MKTNSLIDFDKSTAALRYWILGKASTQPEWYDVHKALQFAGKHHNGVRKDGVTKEFEHQIFQAQMIRGFEKNLLYPRETMIIAFLHDICEDCDISYELIEELFGKCVRIGVENMTKLYKGVKKDNDLYYQVIAECPMASINKPVDRTHNLSTMDGVFKLEKQEEYIDESEKKVLPALKIARRLFPEQEVIYEMLKLIIKQQIALYRSMHKLIKK